MSKNTRTEGVVCESPSREKQVLAILDRMQFRSDKGKVLRHDVSSGSLSVESSGSPIQHRENGSHRTWEGCWREFRKMERWIRWLSDCFQRICDVLSSYMYWLSVTITAAGYVILFRIFNNFFSKDKSMQDSFGALVNLASSGLTFFILGMLLCVAPLIMTYLIYVPIYVPGCEREYTLRVWCMKFVRSYAVRSTGFGMAVMLVSAALGQSVVKIEEFLQTLRERGVAGDSEVEVERIIDAFKNVTIEQGVKLTLMLSLCAVVASFVRGIVGWVNTVEKDRLELLKKLEEYSEVRRLCHENLNKLDVVGLLSGLQNLIRTVELCQRTVVLGPPWVPLVPEVLVKAFVVTQVQWLTRGYAVDEFISPKEGGESEVSDALRAFLLDLKKRSRSSELYEYVRCELSRSVDEKNGQPNSFKLGDELIVVNLLESTLRVHRCLG
mgnify:CR=1 FL=1